MDFRELDIEADDFSFTWNKVDSAVELGVDGASLPDIGWSILIIKFSGKQAQ